MSNANLIRNMLLVVHGVRQNETRANPKDGVFISKNDMVRILENQATPIILIFDDYGVASPQKALIVNSVKVLVYPEFPPKKPEYVLTFKEMPNREFADYLLSQLHESE